MNCDNRQTINVHDCISSSLTNENVGGFARTVTLKIPKKNVSDTIISSERKQPFCRVVVIMEEKVRTSKGVDNSDESSSSCSSTCPLSSCSSQSVVSCSTNGTTASCRFNKKSVRFATTPNGDIVHIEHRGWEEEFTAQEIAKIWYTPFELKIISRYIKKDVIRARKNTDYTDCFEMFYNACGTDQLKNLLSTREEQHLLSTYDMYRGLENFIFSIITTTRSELRRNVFKVQDIVSTSNTMSLHDKEQAIADASQILSVKSRIRAHLHGLDDEQIVSSFV